MNQIEKKDYKSISELMGDISQAAFYGARGNSGVILSRYFKGLYTGMQHINRDILSKDELIDAFVKGYEVAYKAVETPVEGTILTVIREAGQYCQKNRDNYENSYQVINDYVKETNKSLNKTPNILKVLKEAGVVDSGGAGFLKIVSGMKEYLDGNIIKINQKDSIKEVKSNISNLENVDIKFAYCTEFITRIIDSKKKVDEDFIKNRLNEIGDSLVFAHDDGAVKVHIHTNNPSKVLEIGEELGEFVTIKIENMKIQHAHINNYEEASFEKKSIALIAVCMGDGIIETYKSLGVDYIIEGGQTMNPSIEDFVNAIKKVNSKSVIIIPNNKNVILAAKQAKELVDDVEIEVLETKNIAQGYASLMVYNPTMDITLNYIEMKKIIEKVNYGEVTYAVRDAKISGVKIKAEDFLSIVKGSIVSSNKDRFESVKKLLEKIIKKESDIITIFYGQNIEKEELLKIENECFKINKDIDIELIEGNQEIYSYIVVVE